jgi:hypothetical protein
MWLGSSGHEEESENLGAIYLERLQQLLFGLGIGCSSLERFQQPLFCLGTWDGFTGLKLL